MKPLYAEQGYGRYREGLLLILCLGLSACASAAPPAVSCPSSEFAPFLRQFSDPASAKVRQRFTADPLEYEVPTHTVRDDVEGQPATQVELKTGDARMRLFPYRHLKQFDVFVPEDVSHDPVALKSMAAGTFNAPVQIEPSEGGGYNVTFGMEYEADTYSFARRQGCWVLTRATNLRD